MLILLNLTRKTAVSSAGSNVRPGMCWIAKTKKILKDVVLVTFPQLEDLTRALPTTTSPRNQLITKTFSIMAIIIGFLLYNKHNQYKLGEVL